MPKREDFRLHPLFVRREESSELCSRLNLNSEGRRSEPKMVNQASLAGNIL